MEGTVELEARGEPRPNFWRRFCRLCHRTFSPVGGFPFRHAFRLQFWKFGLAQGTPGALWLTAIALHTQGSLRVGILYLAGCKVLLAGFGSAAIVHRYFPIHLNEQGLRARSLWGTAHEIRWEEIVRVQPIRWMIFTRFLRVHTTRRRDLVWLPLFLTDMDAFEAALRELAPETNPLRTWFDEREG